jgi:DNA-binding transcriptional regulator PaaX
VFVSSPRPGPGLRALVARAWDLGGLEERYEAFCSEFSRYLKPPDASLGDGEAFQVRTRMTHVFRAFAQVDPELPDELAPLSGPRTRAADIFEVLYASFAPSSQRHFDAVARSTPAASVTYE